MCYVEQKNGQVVRRAVGYLRHDTDEELAALNAVYDRLCPLVNFFYPSMKLVKKIRTGSKVRRIYVIIPQDLVIFARFCQAAAFSSWSKVTVRY